MVTRLGLALLLITTTPVSAQLATSTTDPCPALCVQGRETALSPEDAKVYRTCVSSRRCSGPPHGPFAFPPDTDIFGGNNAVINGSRDYPSIQKMLRDLNIFR